jgi:hypothetical protein
MQQKTSEVVAFVCMTCSHDVDAWTCTRGPLQLVVRQGIRQLAPFLRERGNDSSIPQIPTNGSIATRAQVGRYQCQAPTTAAHTISIN